MAFSTNDSMTKFGAGPDEVTVASPASVVNNAMSVLGDTVDWVNSEDVNGAMAILVITFSVAPTDGTSVNLYMNQIDVVSTNDTQPPATDFLHEHLASFPVDNVITEQTIVKEVYLPTPKTNSVYHFFIHNDGTGQTITAATWELHIQPIALGPRV